MTEKINLNAETMEQVDQAMVSIEKGLGELSDALDLFLDDDDPLTWKIERENVLNAQVFALNRAYKAIAMTLAMMDCDNAEE